MDRDPVCAKQQNRGHQTSGHKSKEQSGLKDPLNILVFAVHAPCRDQLGDCQRQAVGGQDQSNIVDFVCGVIITDSLIADGPGHGNLVEQSDKTDNDTGRGQNASLDQEVARVGFFLIVTHT